MLKTKTRTRLFLLTALLFSCANLTAQDTPAAGSTGEEEEPAVVRPAESDASSMRLIRNYLTASGGRAAHVRLEAIRAEGQIKEGRELREFELIETRDGQRFLKITWRLLGREYEVHKVSDGSKAWTQEIRPKKKPASLLQGRDAEGFIHRPWFFHPFTGARADTYVFQYQGSARVGGRPAFLIVGYGPGDVRTWFYFDKETFLVTRHGGLGTIAGKEEYFDFLALEFDRNGEVLLPQRLEFMVQDSTFGYADFDEIEVNPKVDASVFDRPEVKEVWLRQETTTR